MSLEKPSLIIIGGGGHAKVVADMLQASPEIQPIGCTDRRHDSGGVLGLPILGDDSLLPELYRQGIRYAFVAIGDNKLRMRLAACAEGIGFRFALAVSRFAYVAESAVLEPGIAVMAGAVVQPEVRVGRHSIVNTGATVDHECSIGEGCHIAPGSHLAGQVTVGDLSFLGMGTKVTPGVSIGRGCVIGAGAVVLGDIPDDSLAVGVPARVIRRLTPI